VDEEFHVCDTNMVWRMRSYDPEPYIEDEAARRFIYALQAVDNGVFSVCQDEALGGMTETSSNLARVETNEKDIMIMSSQRSNVMSNLDNMCNTIAAVFKLAGAKVTHSEGYPAWKMRTNSELQKIVKLTYHKLFQKDPILKGIHAGLECGLFAERYPNLDMVSMGPTLRDVHTPDERLLIPTVQMVWDHLLLTLKSIPHQL
jgi:dipeptidase D